MKSHLPSSFIAIMLLITSAPGQTPTRDPFANPTPKSVSAGLKSKAPDAGHLLFRLRMIALPASEANVMLARSELRAEPIVILTELQKLITEKKARVVANPVIVAQSVFRCVVDGAIRWEIDPVLKPNGKTLAFMMAIDAKNGSNIRYDSEIECGESEFVGTIELPTALRGKAGPEICLVFFSVK